MLRSILQDLKAIKTSGSFIQNLAFVTSSKTLVTIGGFLFTPILSRIYTPEVYGLFAVFDAYIAIGTILATLSLQPALMLPENEETFLDLLKVTIVSSSTVSFLAFPFVSIDVMSGLGELGNFRYLIPILIFLTATNSTMATWLDRKKFFKKTSIRGLVLNYSSKGFNVSYGVLTNGKWDGLIITHLAGTLALFLSNLDFLRRDIATVNWKFNWSKLKDSLKSYIRYPLYILPSEFLERVLSRTPVFFLMPVFGLQELGLLAFANSLLDIPIRLIGENAIGVVLLQKTNELKNRGKGYDLLLLYKKMYLSLTVIAIPFFLIIFFFGERLFDFVFGQEWALSGHYASGLVLFFMVRLINTPTSSIMRILELEKIVIYLIVLRVVVTALAIILAISQHNFELYIWCWSIGYSIITILISGYLFITFRNKNLDIIRNE